MAFFVVHFNYYPACEEYIRFCLLATAKSSPSVPVVFITPSEELYSLILGISQAHCNIRAYLLNVTVFQNISSRLDSIFHHDGINPKWFDFNSILRHLAVRWIIQNDEAYKNIASFATSDSDIAHYFDYRNLLDGIGPYSLTAKNKLSSYFCLWGRESFIRYTEFSFMQQYFVDAASHGGRCSDMHLLAYTLQNSPLKFSPFNESFGIPLDHLRDSLYYTGSWSLVQELSEYSQSDIVNQYPKGIWLNKKFLSDVASKFNRLIDIYHNSERSKLIYLRAHDCIDLINNSGGSSFEGMDESSSFRAYGKSIQQYYQQRCMVLDKVRVPYIHFQGAAKQLISFYSNLLEDE